MKAKLSREQDIDEEDLPDAVERRYVPKGSGEADGLSFEGHCSQSCMYSYTFVSS
jgi:hypothetical protein